MNEHMTAVVVCGACTITSIVLLLWVRGLLDDWRRAIRDIHDKQREIRDSESNIHKYSRTIEAATIALEALGKAKAADKVKIKTKKATP